MALGTLTKVDAWVQGNKRVRVYDVQLSSGANWTAAGESILPSQVGLRKIVEAKILGPARRRSRSRSRTTTPRTCSSRSEPTRHRAPRSATRS
jgi:hypothetical protein